MATALLLALVGASATLPTSFDAWKFIATFHPVVGNANLQSFDPLSLKMLLSAFAECCGRINNEATYK